MGITKIIRTVSILSVLVFVSLLGLTEIVDAKKITLIEKGISYVEIVLPMMPTAFEKQAANNLKEYLQKVTAGTIEIKHENEVIEKIPIYIGRCLASQHIESKVEELINDGYVIEINEGSIHLLGKNDLATRFAVYGFLEDYIDVHWYLPEVWGEDFPENMGTYIPHTDTIILKTTLDIQDPSFKYRYIGRKEEERDEQWTICNKMNFIDRNNHGYQINSVSHSLCTDFVSPKDYYAFPEYFAMVDTERLTSAYLEEGKGYADPENIKLNVGNTDLRDTMVTEVINYIDKRPKIEIINLFPGDGRRFDESPDSKAMDGANYMNYTVEMVNDQIWFELGEERRRVLSKRYTLFYHDVTERILAARPHIFLMTGAYGPSQAAPLEVDDPEFLANYKMDDRVMLFIAHGGSGNNHPIEDRSTEPNIYFDDSIEGWKKLYSNLGVYEYYRTAAMLELPSPILHSIRRDIPYYFANDFSLFFTQYNLNDIGTYALNHYIAAKLVWDVNADVDKLLNDFYIKFYGKKAAPYMRAYFEKLEDAAIAYNREIDPDSYGAFLDLFPDDVLKECTKHLEKARAEAQGNELWSKRIELSEVSLSYTKKVIEYLKEIKKLFNNIDNELIWREYTEEETANAQAMADEISNMLTDSELLKYKTIFKTDYTNSLLNVNRGTINSVREYFYKSFTKEQWLEKNNIAAERGYGDAELFDIWLFAYHLDYHAETGPEHQIRIINKFGNSIEIAQLARETDPPGGTYDQGYLLSLFSFEELIGSNDSLTLDFFNFKGGGGLSGNNPTTSTFHAIAIMPHMDDIQQDDVTWYYKNDVNYIRQKALGFIEFRGLNDDFETLTVTIDLYSH